MQWNTMQEYYMPQQNNDPFTNRYMGNLLQMLQGFGQQYGSPNRQYIAPRFNTYQPDYSGFNPMASYYQRGMSPNQMFDPRMASLFGAGQLGNMVPNSQQGNQMPMSMGGYGNQGGYGNPGGMLGWFGYGQQRYGYGQQNSYEEPLTGLESFYGRQRQWDRDPYYIPGKSPPPSNQWGVKPPVQNSQMAPGVKPLQVPVGG